MDVSNARITTSGSHYHHYCSYNNKSKRISGLGSHEPKYYDQIITKVNLLARKQQHERLIRDQTAISGKRVLLVDDEPDICMVYQIVLEDAGYQCTSYTDPVKALQEFKPYFYDLILLDIKMPVLNGFELCRKIIELDRTVHIIFITASEEYYEQFRTQHYPELGKINYIQKPVSNDELVQIVDMIVANSITIDQLKQKQEGETGE
jgi:CheY-like chemotaxis protein